MVTIFRFDHMTGENQQYNFVEYLPPPHIHNFCLCSTQKEWPLEHRHLSNALFSSLSRNVSKHNYCFSDFPFPDDVPDYPHHTDMAEYINSYAEHFGIKEHISFSTKVVRVEKVSEGWKITSVKVDDE